MWGVHDWGDQTKGPCDLHEITGCVICQPKPKPVPKPRAQVVGARPMFRTTAETAPVVPAAYESECPSCGDMIEEGDLITLSYGEWVHKGCAL
jgi:hypothetical protein